MPLNLPITCLKDKIKINWVWAVLGAKFLGIWVISDIHIPRGWLGDLSLLLLTQLLGCCLLWVKCSSGRLIFRIWASICGRLPCSECRHASCACVFAKERCVPYREIRSLGHWNQSCCPKCSKLPFYFLLRHTQLTVIPPGFWKCQLTLFSPLLNIPLPVFLKLTLAL